jgi:hypothetical protein
MSIKRFVTRVCAAALLAVGAMVALPAERASAQDFSIQIGPDGVRVGGGCPRTYDPVCAGPRSNPRTYRNACLARRDEARIRYEGECRRGGGGYIDGGGVRVCPEIYAPVCARQRNGVVRTLSSACVAASVGARVLYNGECQRGGGGDWGGSTPPYSGGACPRIYAPVCAGPRGNERTYSNSCVAQRAGARIRYSGQCAGGFQQPVWPGRPGVSSPPSPGFDEEEPVTNRPRW